MAALQESPRFERDDETLPTAHDISSVFLPVNSSLYNSQLWDLLH